jgi:hypothetical protein
VLGRIRSAVSGRGAAAAKAVGVGGTMGGRHRLGSGSETPYSPLPTAHA